MWKIKQPDLLEKHIRMNQEILDLPNIRYKSTILLEELQSLLLELRERRKEEKQ